VLVQEKRSIYFAVELSLREISYVLYAHALICALITRKSCEVGVRNAKQGIILNPIYKLYRFESFLRGK